MATPSSVAQQVRAAAALYRRWRLKDSLTRSAPRRADYLPQTFERNRCVRWCFCVCINRIIGRTTAASDRL